MDDDEPGFGMRTATLRDYQRKHHAEVTALSQAAGEVDVATSAGGGSRVSVALGGNGSCERLGGAVRAALSLLKAWDSRLGMGF